MHSKTTLCNHDPKHLSEKVYFKLVSGGYDSYMKKHPMASLSKPSPAVVAQWHKGAPNGLVNAPYSPIKSFRDFSLTPQQRINGFTVLDIFCGGGLGTVGMEAAGFTVIKAFDYEKNAVKAYKHNFGNHVEQIDITDISIDTLPDADVVFGGPPCQDFSLAGKGRGVKGDRGSLIWSYLDIIKEKQPKAFIFENVKGLVSKRHIDSFNELVCKFNSVGYEVNWKLINSWDYGVAQKRERVFIVGIRKDLGFLYEFPTPLKEDARSLVLGDVIGDLPAPGEYPDHVGTKTKFRNGKSQGDRVVSVTQPSPTIRAEHHGNIEGFDPKELHSYLKKNAESSSTYPRRFTIRECLRIQSVPDSYQFPEDVSISAQYKIVGNGIPSRVAWYLGCALATQLRETTDRVTRKNAL
ncbi:DNA cytosine methyltransferase [Bacillus pumilus]|uniref:DNA cytosine methyltransferase n=2 Tax=Bacillus pumilus TaxID=1408 RepID=UPI0011E936F5|nr:DNA cytosine methyltransferase [Bacillus pumilus]